MKNWRIVGKMERIYFEFCACPHCRSHKNSEFLDVDLQVQADDEQAALNRAYLNEKEKLEAQNDDSDLDWWMFKVEELAA